MGSHPHPLLATPRRTLPDGFSLAEDAPLAARKRLLTTPAPAPHPPHTTHQQTVARATIWFDEVNLVGLFEPVETDEGFRRLGLARAVMTERPAHN